MFAIGNKGANVAQKQKKVVVLTQQSHTVADD